MLTKTVKSKCEIRDIICDIPHRVEIEKTPPQELYNIAIYTSEFSTDSPRYRVFINRDMLEELYNCISDILFYKEKIEE